MNNRVKKVSLLGVLIALAFIFSYIESLLPNMAGIPGIRLGLANLVVLTALYYLGKKEALLLSIVRVILTGLTFGSLFSAAYSLAGAMLSFLIMLLLMRAKSFSMLGVSIAGGITHNIGQIVIAYILMGDAILYYLPWLLISGTVAGAIIGLLGGLILMRLPQRGEA